MLTEILLLFFALFNLYLLWRIDKVEKEYCTYEDVRDIFELIVNEITDNDK